MLLIFKTGSNKTFHNFSPMQIVVRFLLTLEIVRLSEIYLYNLTANLIHKISLIYLFLKQTKRYKRQTKRYKIKFYSTYLCPEAVALPSLLVTNSRLLLQPG